MTDDLTEDVTTPENQSDESVEDIAGEIEDTREEMTGTVQAIGERLDPANIVQDAKETVRDATIGRVEDMTSNAMDTATETGSGILETIRRNPLPAAMAAIGVGMLLMNRSDGRRSHRPDRDWDGAWRDTGDYRAGQGSGSGVTERAGETMDQVGQKASRVASDVRSTVGDLPDHVGTTARDVGGNAQRVVEENPLAVGAVAFAVGAAIGMALPTTDVERDVLGQAADRAINTAEQTAQQAVRQLEPSNA
jgi:ElaB/YqjD/DUF883 family membrane-anchored ribosome-binding protein